MCPKVDSQTSTEIIICVFVIYFQICWAFLKHGFMLPWFSNMLGIFDFCVCRLLSKIKYWGLFGVISILASYSRPPPFVLFISMFLGCVPVFVWLPHLTLGFFEQVGMVTTCLANTVPIWVWVSVLFCSDLGFTCRSEFWSDFWSEFGMLVFVVWILVWVWPELVWGSLNLVQVLIWILSEFCPNPSLKGIGEVWLVWIWSDVGLKLVWL